jgi:hypothetical protein
MADNQLQKYEKRRTSLNKKREELLPEWRDIEDAYCVRRSPYLRDSGKNATKFNRRNKKIVNTHPVTAARTHQRGMTAGIASPARPWFRLRAPDRELNKYKPVSLWLNTVQQILEDLFARSNFYNSVGVGYGDQGKFGTLAIGLFEDAQDDLRCTTYPIGSYLIAVDATGRARTIYRQYRQTALQIVEKFALVDNYGRPISKPDFSRVSDQVKTAYEGTSTRDTEFDIVHVVEPRLGRKPGIVDSRNMPISSCYYEPCQAGSGTLLRESGFEEDPVLVARWDVDGEDAWGTGPGLDALGDSLALQYRAKQKAKKLDKHNDPALVGHPDLKNKRVSLLNGDVTYVGFTANGGQPQLKPIHEVDADVSSINADEKEMEARISRVWDEDLFLMLSMSDAKDVTAEAIAKKWEEKVVMMGPVLERQNDELFDPAIERGFAIAMRRGLIPPPPGELEDSPLKVEYVSTLAQAQRLVSASTIERMVGFIGGLAKAQADAGESPEVLDKINFDEAVDEYAEALGTVPTVIRSDEEVEAIREQRRQRQQAQALAAAAKPVADVAKATKDLSQAPVGGASALDRLVGAQ